MVRLVSKVLYNKTSIKEMSSIHIQSRLCVTFDPNRLGEEAINLIIQKIEAKQLRLNRLTKKIQQFIEQRL